MRQLRLVVLAAALGAASTASAQSAQPAEAAQAVARKPFMFGMTANHMSIDPVAASAQKIGAQAWGMQFDGGFTLGKYLVVAADFAPQMLSDKAAFTQTTTVGDKSSSAMLMYFSAMAGPRTAPFRIIPGLAPAALALYGGASTTKGERSIDNCFDCTTQTIAIDGGKFVQPTITFGDGIARMRVSDRYYPGAKGIRSVISAGVEVGGR